MQENEIIISVEDKKYYLELEAIDPRALHTDKFLAKIKSQDNKYFTYEFHFGHRFNPNTKNRSTFIKDKILEITKVKISENVFKDQLIVVFSVCSKQTSPDKELKKHSTWYEKE